jgi:hypothetical protein
MRTNPEYERIIEPVEAAAMLSARIERGTDDGSSWALHLHGQTLFINSETPIEFAVAVETDE